MEKAVNRAAGERKEDAHGTYRHDGIGHTRRSTRMTDKQLSCEGYEFDGPHMVRNERGNLNDVYKVRRLSDGAELSLVFAATTFKDSNLQVCKAIPSDGWLPEEYNGCTFIAVNQSAEVSDTAESLVVDPRLWSLLWQRDRVPPMKYFPGSFLADFDSEEVVVWRLMMEQVEVGIRRLERSRRDRAGKDTGVLLSEWADSLTAEDIASLAPSE